MRVHNCLGGRKDKREVWNSYLDKMQIKQFDIVPEYMYFVLSIFYIWKDKLFYIKQNLDKTKYTHRLETDDKNLRLGLKLTINKNSTIFVKGLFKFRKIIGQQQGTVY